MKNKKTIIAVALVCIIGIITGTFAYFSTTDVFHNLFDTEIYKNEITEVFESPQNWRPGDTTPKTVSVTNTGNVDMAVRISLYDEWRGPNNEFSWNEYRDPDTRIDKPIAEINFSSDNMDSWYYVEGYGNDPDVYYYKYKLAKSETTSPLIESVTFSPDFVIENDSNNSGTKETCTYDESEHKKTCVVTPSEFSDWTYKLTIKIETTDFDLYKDAWNTTMTLLPEKPNNMSDYINTLYVDYTTNTRVARADDPDHNVRYVGGNPNNYVLFNDELWRMIGSFDGRVKLIRNEPIGSYSWDVSNDTGANGGKGINDWSQADLMYELNGDYLNSDLQEDTLWKIYSSTATFDHTKVLKSSAQDLIDDATWYLGAGNVKDGAVYWDYSAYQIYNNEHGNVFGKICTPDEYDCSDTYERHATWTGKVGLISTSDALYASDDTGCQGYYWKNTCNSKNWITSKVTDYAFTITPGAYNTSAYYVGNFGHFGITYTIGTLNKNDVYPSVYLKHDVIYTGGKGTHDDPFILSL